MKSNAIRSVKPSFMPNARSPRRREPTRSPRPRGRSPRRWSFPPSSAGRVPVPLRCEWRANGRNRPSWRSPPGNRPADASRWYGACTASSQRTRTISTTWWNAPAGPLALMSSPVWASASSSSPASRSARPAPPTVCVLLSSGRRRATRSRSSRPVIFRCAQPGPKLDIAALDLFAQLFDQLGNPLQVRMDRQRAAECIKRVLLVAHLLQDDAEPRQRAEVARFACQHLVDGGERAAALLILFGNGRAAVPCLGEIRPDIDDGVEQPNGKVEFLLVGRGFGAAHQQIGGIAARREPDRPDAILDVFRALVVRRDLERREQPVEIMRLVAMLRTRQRARRLDRFERLGIDGFSGGRQDARRRHQPCRQPSEESLPHGRRLTLRPATIKIGVPRGRRQGRSPGEAQGRQPWRALNRRWTLLIT